MLCERGLPLFSERGGGGGGGGAPAAPELTAVDGCSSGKGGTGGGGACGASSEELSCGPEDNVRLPLPFNDFFLPLLDDLPRLDGCSGGVGGSGANGGITCTSVSRSVKVRTRMWALRCASIWSSMSSSIMFGSLGG